VGGGEVRRRRQRCAADGPALLGRGLGDVRRGGELRSAGERGQRHDGADKAGQSCDEAMR
jgi:hypothetical protein